MKEMLNIIDVFFSKCLKDHAFVKNLLELLNRKLPKDIEKVRDTCVRTFCPFLLEFVFLNYNSPVYIKLIKYLKYL